MEMSGDVDMSAVHQAPGATTATPPGLSAASMYTLSKPELLRYNNNAIVRNVETLPIKSGVDAD